MMSPEEIIGEVALISGIPAPAITGRRRTNRIARARYLAIAAIQSAYSDYTLETVGEIFRRDHNTIAHASRRHRQLLKTDHSYQTIARQVCRSIFYGPATLR